MPLVDAVTPPSTPRGYAKEVVAITDDTTITANHGDRVLAVNSGSNVTLTLPNDLPYGFYFEWVQRGAGRVLFSAASGATLTSYASADRSLGQYAEGQCEVVSQNATHGLGAVYALSGDLTDSSGLVLTAANTGTAGTGVTAVHYGDGVNNTAVLTLTNVAITVGNSADLATGALIYTLPAGACLINSAYMSVGISGVTTTTDTPDVGLGTVIGSGAVATLDGTATFENIITGQTAADTNGTATVKGAGPTAGAPLEITTGGAHTVHFNAADGWGANADASGLLNGTVVLSYTRQAA